jgi:hypothetical protein
MAHDDQFTATGPPFTGSGFPRAAFSTKATGMVYGANVQGDRAGVYAESVRAETDRESDVEGVGVHGEGDNFGVFGRTFASDAGSEVAGVFGEHNRGGVGVIGAVMRGGTGVAGVSVASLGNPIATFVSLPDPADGSGTGVFGSSGSGAGVRGTSRTSPGVLGTSQASAGVRGESQDSDAVVGKSGSGRGGVFESGTNAAGSPVGQVGLVPHAMIVPDAVPFAPVVFDPRVVSQLPTDGRGGDLLVTRGQDNRCTLWFCTLEAHEDQAAQWCQVLLGPPVRRQAVSRILWPRQVLASTGGGSPTTDPQRVIGEPNGLTQALVPGVSATFGGFRSTEVPDISQLLNASTITHGDAVTAEMLARTDVIAFERNGGGPASGQGWESCDWTFADGATTVFVRWDERAGAPRDRHIVANGSLRGRDYLRYFGIPLGEPAEFPIGENEVISFLLFGLADVNTGHPEFKIMIAGTPNPATGEEASPDVDAIGVVPRPT